MANESSVLKPGVARRFAWIVINVSDAERSCAFYERFTRLRRRGRIAGEGRPAFGVERAAFAGYELREAGGDRRPSVLLVQWRDPPAMGATYPSHTNPGYLRACFQVPDGAAHYEAVRAAGFETLTPLRMPKPGRSVGRPVFCVRDPDGAIVQFVTQGAEPRLFHVNCNTNSLAQADQFFSDVLGLDCVTHSTSTTPEAHAFGPGGDLHTYDARLYRAVDGSDAPPPLLLDVVESTFPPPTGAVYASPTNVGFARVAIEVDDVEAAYETLRAKAPACLVRPPEFWRLGPDLGWRLAAVVCSPDGAPVDLIGA
jgi:catechol 2,3-dioxygenase-like lactoylglutathione lyase family enzyme